MPGTCCCVLPDQIPPLQVLGLCEMADFSAEAAQRVREALPAATVCTDESELAEALE